MYYFASDVHLGAGSPQEKRRVETQFVAWLNRVAQDADAIFLCGDIFDFWFEYREVIPKGFSRTLGTLSSLTDRGVRVIFMAGNHDMWLGSYLGGECGLEIYTTPKEFDLGGMKVHVAHGDNLNVSRVDWKLRLINKIFRSKSAYSIFSRVIHPDLMLRFGQAWSDQSRTKHNKYEGLEAKDNPAVQALVEYAATHHKSRPCDLYVYGHLHIPFRYEADGLRVLFTNDWRESPQYIKLTANGDATIESVEELLSSK